MTAVLVETRTAAQDSTDELSVTVRAVEDSGLDCLAVAGRAGFTTATVALGLEPLALGVGLGLGLGLGGSSTLDTAAFLTFGGADRVIRLASALG